VNRAISAVIKIDDYAKFSETAFLAQALLLQLIEPQGGITT
jgi:hypothetical protein